MNIIKTQEAKNDVNRLISSH